MWNLDDESLYFRLLNVTVPYAFTWGNKDREKRELIRKAVEPDFPADFPKARWWAFRIFASKRTRFDVENIPKLIVDAFLGIPAQPR